MIHDTSDPAQPPYPPAQTALPQEPSPRNLRGQDVDPASLAADEDEEARLPEQDDETAEPAAEGTLAVGRAAIERAVKLAPTSPGVYRMLNAANDVLYVGKAKSVKKRLASYARPTGHPWRASRA
jgi:excinuclease ABC subunit C